MVMVIAVFGITVVTSMALWRGIDGFTVTAAVLSITTIAQYVLRARKYYVLRARKYSYMRTVKRVIEKRRRR